MTTRRLQTLTWILIYGGLLLGIWTLFVQPANGGQAAVIWPLRALAAAAAVAGAVLIRVRARMPD